MTGSIAAAMLGRLPPPRQAVHAIFRAADGAQIDSGLALFFPAPHSFTGEDVLELQGHGGAVVSGLVVARVLELGARRAEPGEFSQRAYRNGKLDLAQAEALADLINAGSAEAARAAVRSLEGEFSRAVHELAGELLELRVHVEAAIDFPAEEIDFLADADLADGLARLRQGFDELQRRSSQGRLLTEGMRVVIAGAPNAGKSTLLNRLAGHDAAIVTATPGTTRDVLRERILIDGMPVHVIDTAGLREAGEAIEAEGVRRARAEIARADRVLFVVDVAADSEARGFTRERGSLPAEVPVTVLMNKCDLVQTRGRARAGAHDLAGDVTGLPVFAGVQTLSISAQTGAGVDALRAHLASAAGLHTGEGSALSARARHLEALARARAHLDAAATQLRERRAGELVAEELRRSLDVLGEITGEVDSEELLGRIFAGFCIGK